MSKRYPHDAMLAAFENPTKLSILMLLAKHGRMTVTQMSESVGVTRANLYHFAGDLVKDGLLKKPEIEAKQNYIEKYYRINEEAFDTLEPSEQEKTFESMNSEHKRNLLKSFFASLSLLFRIQVRLLEAADSQSLREITDMFKKKKATISYSIVSDDAYESALSEIKKTNATLERWGRTKRGGELNRRNTVILIALPSFEETKEGRSRQQRLGVKTVARSKHS